MVKKKQLFFNNNTTSFISWTQRITMKNERWLTSEDSSTSSPAPPPSVRRLRRRMPPPPRRSPNLRRPSRHRKMPPRRRRQQQQQTETARLATLALSWTVSTSFSRFRISLHRSNVTTFLFLTLFFSVVCFHFLRFWWMWMRVNESMQMWRKLRGATWRR